MDSKLFDKKRSAALCRARYFADVMPSNRFLVVKAPAGFARDYPTPFELQCLVHD